MTLDDTRFHQVSRCVLGRSRQLKRYHAMSRVIVAPKNVNPKKVIMRIAMRRGVAFGDVVISPACATPEKRSMCRSVILSLITSILDLQFRPGLWKLTVPCDGAVPTRHDPLATRLTAIDTSHTSCEDGALLREITQISAAFIGRTQHQCDQIFVRCFRRSSGCDLACRTSDDGGPTNVPASGPGTGIHMLDVPREP